MRSQEEAFVLLVRVKSTSKRRKNMGRGYIGGEWGVGGEIFEENEEQEGRHLRRMRNRSGDNGGVGGEILEVEGRNMNKNRE
jgi:hypothetical protein